MPTSTYKPTYKPTTPSRSSGFTLIELLVVLAIMAAVSAVVLVRFEAPYRAARGAHQKEELVQWINRARQHSWRHGCGAVLKIDLDRGLFRHQPSTTLEGCRDLQLDGTLRIAGARLGGRRADHGEVELRIGPRGAGESFALELVPSGQKPLWLLVAGGSGQVLEFASKEGVDDAFAVFQTGAHAP